MKLAHLAAVTALFTSAGTANAFQASDIHERPLEVAAGAAARTGRVTAWRAPRVAMTSWNDFQVQHGSWVALWDRDTGIPLRIWGEGISVPGGNGDATVAEQAVRRLLAQHLTLLAPGSSLKDFVTIANVVHGDKQQFRTVSMQQTWHGMPVVGGAVTFLFQNDRISLIGSTASRDVVANDVTSFADPSKLELAATHWIETVYGSTPTVRETGDAEVLPIVDINGATSYRTVIPVTVDLASPVGRWRVYTDAATGAVVARSQMLMFGSGTLKYHVPIRWPGDAHEDAVAASTTHHVAGAAVTSDLAGLFTWTGTAAASVTPGLVGTYAKIFNQAGSTATATLSVSDGGSAVWSPGTSATVDAQLTAFIRMNETKQWVKTHLNSSLAWLGQQVSVYVNESGTCNAYSTGDDVHFYPANNQCENTGRLADVMRHETGHSVHYQSIIPGAGAFDGSLSEGMGDTLASEIAGTSHMGIGFFFNDQPLRELAPSVKKTYPQDMDGEPHDEGEIIGETLWDLRVGMIASLGATAGAAQTEHIYYAIVQRAADIPSAYAEALAEDDDDGNLANGTPHKCIIDSAVSAHGLADPSSGGSASVAPPALNGNTLTLTPSGGNTVCPGPAMSSAVVTWRLRETPSTTGSVNFAASGQNFVATLPTQPDGSVVQYQVAVTFSDGSSQTFPNNAADTWYETYVGPVTNIYCTDFESNPGWTATGDMQWGAPTGGANDPGAAYSGTSEIADNLAGDYADSSTSSVTTQAITIPSGYDKVRLQYRRWLSVEDSLYDHATISVDGSQVWINKQTAAGTTQHRDHEWRFQDVDITSAAGDGSVQVAFGLTSDEGLHFGGWNIDNFCIVGVGGQNTGTCGDGNVGAGEECDDGNNTNGDGCSASCTVEHPGDPDAGTVDGPDAGTGGNDDGGIVDPGGDDTGTPGGGCCSASGGAQGSLALGLLTIVAIRRRRR